MLSKLSYVEMANVNLKKSHLALSVPKAGKRAKPEHGSNGAVQLLNAGTPRSGLWCFLGCLWGLQP